MIINKKGVTLVELIVSIALISVVMLFIFRLISDITFDKDNEYFASNNQRQRMEIINSIEDILLNDIVNGYTIEDNNNKITFTLDNDVNKTLVLTDNNTISFDGQKWTLNDGYSYGTIKCRDNSPFIECSIETYTNNKDNTQNNNNTIDDITFTFKLK